MKQSLMKIECPVSVTWVSVLYSLLPKWHEGYISPDKRKMQVSLMSVGAQVIIIKSHVLWFPRWLHSMWETKWTSNIRDDRRRGFPLCCQRSERDSLCSVIKFCLLTLRAVVQSFSPRKSQQQIITLDITDKKKIKNKCVWIKKPKLDLLTLCVKNSRKRTTALLSSHASHQNYSRILISNHIHCWFITSHERHWCKNIG